MWLRWVTIRGRGLQAPPEENRCRWFTTSTIAYESYSAWDWYQSNRTTKKPITSLMKKKLSEETQTLRAAGCSKAEPKIFAPPQTPFPEARDGQNLISCRWSLPFPVWWGSMHAISSYRGNRPTHTQTHPATHPPTHPLTNRTDCNTLRRS